MALQSTTALATITLQAATSEVVFSGIPNTYRDLILVVQGTSSVDDQLSMRLNGDSGSNYHWVQMGADPGSGVFSSAGSSVNRARIGYASTSQGSHIVQIQDAPATDKHKTVLSRSNKGASDVRAVASRWANTAAVTSITVIQDNGNLASGSTFSLYGRIA